MTIKTKRAARAAKHARASTDTSLFRLLSSTEAVRARAIAYEAALSVIG